MPMSVVTPPGAPAATLVAGLRWLLDWATKHPNIPTEQVYIADDGTVEVQLRPGGFDALAAVAQLAAELPEPVIDVSDTGGRAACVTASGGVGAAGGHAVVIDAWIYDAAKDALLASLGDPHIPDPLVWRTTVEHLRSLAGGAR